jgi:hypothetical protein
MTDDYETEGRPGVGLPLGNQTSQWFGIFYLDSLDCYIKEVLRVKRYIRYMDDFLLVHHDKDFLRSCLADITEDSRGRSQIDAQRKDADLPAEGRGGVFGMAVLPQRNMV